MAATIDRPIRVMIVDDSIVARAVFRRILEQREGFEVVAVAHGADHAVSLLAGVTVDIILLDIEMPGTDGLTALPRILASGGGARVLVVSSACADGGVTTVAALALGAADTLLKPGTADIDSRFGDRLAERLRRIGPCMSHLRQRAAHAPQFAIRAPRTTPVECLAIGASTGGIHALTALFEALPTSFRAPILITQHLPGEFMPYFAAQLEQSAARSTTVARDGETVRGGRILVAPGSGHLRLTRDRDGVRIQIDDGPAPSGCQPSVDPMLSAVAETFGTGGVGVVLSGMGRDGAIGARRLSEAGGELIVQDEASATIWGMPGVIARAGLADAVLPPAMIGWRIGQRPGATSWT